jgi:hypothetical protein
VLGGGDGSGQSIPARLRGCSGRWWRVSAERWLKLELVGGMRLSVLAFVGRVGERRCRNDA